MNGSDIALQKLISGNSRFVSFKLAHPNQTANRQKELLNSQKPFAVILSCSDSRVPPEIIFDQGLGDLFVIRVAGNIINDHVIGSIEYAVKYLGASLVMVLGHENCGAVTTAVNGYNKTSHIHSLVEFIQTAVDKAKIENTDILDSSIRYNIENVVNSLKEAEPILSEYVKDNKLQIIGAYYRLDTGKVELLDQ